MRHTLLGFVFALSAGCALFPQKPIVLSEGPRGVPASAQLGEMVAGGFTLNCLFDGGGMQAFVIYRPAGEEWRPMATCNNGAGKQAPRQFVPANDPDQRRLITAWYTQNGIWKQCAVKGTIQAETRYVSCLTPGGYASTLSCPITECREP